jgi:Ca-activated chloride channel family protein
MPALHLKTWAALIAAIALAACALQSTAPKDGPEMETAEPAQPLAPPPPPPPPLQYVTPPPPQAAAPRGEETVVAGARRARSTQDAAAAIGGRFGAVTGGLNGAQRPYQPLPGTVDRDRYEDVDPNPVKEVAEEPVSTFSVDVDTAAYANVRRMLNAGRLPPKDAARIEELINYFQYDYRAPADRTRPFEANVALAPSPWGHGRQLLHVGLQGYNIVPRNRPPLNLVLLIDVSGSMSDENKLPLALQAFRILVNQLNARDHVAIAVYAGAAGSILDPTSGDDKSRILAALDQLHAGGSTAGGEGLRLAYALAERNFSRTAINRVIIATDGDFNVGINDPEQLQDFVERKRETGIYLSVLGFGGGNYNDLLMQKLAQNGNGTAAYIDTLAEARRVFDTEMASTLFPIANDVKIQIEFNPERVAEYRLIGYETRMLNREDFNNDAVDAGEIGAGHSVTAIYELTPPGGRTLIDTLRYQRGERPAPGSSGEIAFLRMRYKLPGESESRLIERPIIDADAFADIAAAPESTRWAAAVAAYGQLLRGDPHLDRGYDWQNVIDLAQGARGRDPYGWRAEFVQLVRAAQSAAPLPTLEQEGGREPPRRPPPRPVPQPRSR